MLYSSIADIFEAAFIAGISDFSVADAMILVMQIYFLTLKYKIKGGLGKLGNLDFTQLEGDAEVNRILSGEDVYNYSPYMSASI
jgi:hypothetical protein